MVSRASSPSTTWGKHPSEREKSRKYLCLFLRPDHVTDHRVHSTPFWFFLHSLRHFVLTTALLDRIKESQPSRIVVMSTSLHENASGINYDTIYKTGDTSQPHHQSAWDRFYRSKLANIMFAKALARRLGTESGVYVNCANPGYVSTESTRPVNGGGMLDGLKDWAHSLVTYPVERGALTPLYLATSSEVEEMKITGRYFGPVANELEPCKFGVFLLYSRLLTSSFFSIFHPMLTRPFFSVESKLRKR